MKAFRKIVAFVATLACSFVGVADFVRISDGRTVVVHGEPTKADHVRVPARPVTFSRMARRSEPPAFIPGMGTRDEVLNYRAVISTELGINIYQTGSEDEDLWISFNTGSHQFSSYADFVKTLHATMATLVREHTKSSNPLFDPNRPIKFFWALVQYDESTDEGFYDNAFFGNLSAMPEQSGEEWKISREIIEGAQVQVNLDHGWRFSAPVAKAKLLSRNLLTGRELFKDWTDVREVNIYTRSGDFYLAHRFCTNGQNPNVEILFQLEFESGKKKVYDKRGHEVVAQLDVAAGDTEVKVTVVGGMRGEVYAVNSTTLQFHSSWRRDEIRYNKETGNDSLLYPVVTNLVHAFRLSQ